MLTHTLSHSSILSVITHSGHSWALLFTMIISLCVLLILKISSERWKISNPQLKARIQKELLKFFDKDELELGLRHYVPMGYQLYYPANHKQAQSIDQTEFKAESLPAYFTRHALKSINPWKYFFVMADPGSGKTTFLINLYAECVGDTELNKEIRFLSLRQSSTLEKIAEVSNPEKCILFLDGLNEDMEAVRNFEDRITQLQEFTKRFFKVIITCRRKFYCREIEEDFESFLNQHSAEMYQAKACHICLSPFDTSKAKEYIRKRYSVVDFRKRKQAMELLETNQELIRQPLLLSYIETLAEAPKAFYSHSYQLYESLIKTWIAQSSVSKQNKERDFFTQKVWVLMQDLAVNIYQRYTSQKSPYIKENDTADLIYKHKLHPEELYSYSKAILTHQDAEGYRFWHSSIFEYFIAKEAYENIQFLSKLDTAGLEQARKFWQEMIVHNDMALLKGDSEKGIDPFYLSKFLTTVAEYRSFCEATGKQMPNAPAWGWQDNAPIIGINWDDVMEYCEWISNLTGLNFSIPNEWEWEYAARGGNLDEVFTFSGSNSLDKVAWHGKNSGRQTQAVGKKEANSLGIYDMSGLVWEWCSNWFEESMENHNGPEPENSRGKAIRGGSWLHYESSCKIETRGWHAPKTPSFVIGLRLKLDYPE